MAKKQDLELEVQQVIEAKYNCLQACNMFNLNGINRRIMFMKYKKKRTEKREWELILQKENFL